MAKNSKNYFFKFHFLKHFCKDFLPQIDTLQNCETKYLGKTISILHKQMAEQLAVEVDLISRAEQYTAAVHSTQYTQTFQTLEAPSRHYRNFPVI